MDQLQGMRVFTRVAELGSFVRAANTLELSRAMASSYVAQLEKHLGTRLLHRTTRKVSVSPQGAVYLEHCKRILAEIDAADDKLRLARNRPRSSASTCRGLRRVPAVACPDSRSATGHRPRSPFQRSLMDIARACRRRRARRLVIRQKSSRSISASRLLTCASPNFPGA
jgi:DNA-binding transcriptional LysR family regulator